MEWILASASPRRKQLLGELIKDFTILPAKGEEVCPVGVTGAALVQALACQKAEEVAGLPIATGKAVLGADTIVCLDGAVLGKPQDAADATRMLRALSGKRHEVYTGVCIVYTDEAGNRQKLVSADCTGVYFNELDEAFISDYVAGGSPMDKAGAYGIQDGGLVERIEGSFSNVVGLPVELCRRMIEEVKKRK